MDCQIVKQGAPRKPQGSPNAGISGFALQKNVGATWELVIELLRCPLETHRKTPGSHMYSGQKVLSIIRHQNTQLLMKNLNILFKNFIFSSIWVLSLNQFQKLAKAIVVLFICMQRSKYFLVLELEIQLAKLLYYLYTIEMVLCYLYYSFLHQNYHHSYWYHRIAKWWEYLPKNMGKHLLFYL